MRTPVYDGEETKISPSCPIWEPTLGVSMLLENLACEGEGSQEWSEFFRPSERLPSEYINWRCCHGNRCGPGCLKDWTPSRQESIPVCSRRRTARLHPYWHCCPDPSSSCACPHQLGRSHHSKPVFCFDRFRLEVEGRGSVYAAVMERKG